MINRSYESTVGELFQQLRSAGKIIAPVPGTPLELLNNTTPMIEPIHGEDTYNFSLALVADQSHMKDYSSESESQHTIVLKEITRNSAKRVRALLDLARNHINPMVNKVIEDINSEYSRRLNKVAINLEVVTNKVNPLFKNDSILNIVNTYNVFKVGTNVNRPSYINDFIENKIEYLSQVVPGVEAELTLYLGSLGDEYLATIYNRYFAAGEPYEMGVPDEDALVVLLYAHRLAHDENTIEFANNVGIGTLKSSLNQLAALAAIGVKNNLSAITRREKYKTLVLSYPTSGKLSSSTKAPVLQIVVDDAAYIDFLNTGGSPDILCGAFLDDKARGSEELMANSDRYLKLWERQVNMIRQQNETSKFDIFKRTVINSISQQLNENFDQVDGVPYDREKIIGSLLTYLSTLSPLSVNNPYPIILNIVSKCVYQNAQAEQFLLDMEQINKQSPDLDMREVAAQATLNYITMWVRSQMVIGA